MAELTEMGIVLSASGGDAAANEIRKPTEALNRLSTGHQNLRSKFSERFSAVALDVYSKDALRAIGVNEDLRKISSALEFTFMSLGNSLGILTSKLGVYIAIIGAAVAVYSKIKSSHDEQEAAVDKAATAQVRFTGDIKKTITTLENYAKYFGPLTKELGNYKKELEGIARIEETRARRTIQEQVSQTISALASIRETNKELQASFAQYTKVNESISNFVEWQKKAGDQGGVLEEWIEIFTNTRMKNLGGKLDDNTKKFVNLRENLKILQAQLRMMDFKPIIAGMEEAVDSAKELEDKLEEVRAQYEMTATKTMDTFQDGFNKAAGTVSTAMAKSIVEGEKFRVTMKDIITDIVATWIQQMAQLAIQGAVFQSITAPLFGLNSGGGIMPHATGADYIVGRPTMFMAGENGVERVRVEQTGAGGRPVTQQWNNNTTRNASIGAVHINIGGGSNAGNPQALAAEIGRQLIKRIRGRGELGMV